MLTPGLQPDAPRLAFSEIARVVERHRLVERLGYLWETVRIQLLADTTFLWISPPTPSDVDLPFTPNYTAPITFKGQVCATLAVMGETSGIRSIADMIVIWLEDLLSLEYEVGSLAHEVVRSYEELHLLYELGEALVGVLDVEQACQKIVQSILLPLDAAHASLTLLHLGMEQVIAHVASAERGDGAANPLARAVSILQVSGVPIGSVAVQGKLHGTDFSSGDLKLLDGVAAVSGPAIRQAQLYQEARLQADTDSLTGVYNHRRSQEGIDEELERARREGHALSVMLVEVDDLRFFHDLYGHVVGNSVLRVVSEYLRMLARASDLVGSYGDDKFIVVLPQTDASGATALARRVAAAVSGHDMLVDSARLPVGLSIGVAAFPEHSVSKHDLIAQAAAALGEARASGGGNVRCSGVVEAENPAMAGETFTVLQGLVRAIDAKDHYTQEHSDVVTDAALLLGKRLNLPEASMDALRIAGLLHDVGKIGIPDFVLKKPGKLKREEYEIMKQHVVLSETIIRGVAQTEEVLEAVAHHHERYDGTGYPYGKLRDEIPLLGRILGIADAYSAMSMNRPYRKGMDWLDIRIELEDGAGTQFDPWLVRIFVEAVDTLHTTKTRSEHVYVDRR